MKRKNNFWNICGLLTGVAAIFVGISLLKQEFYTVATLDELKFGADFYTEMYDVTRRIHALLTNINDLIEYVKTGFGYLFVFGGIIDICVFASKLSFTENKPTAATSFHENE